MHHLMASGVGAGTLDSCVIPYSCWKHTQVVNGQKGLAFATLVLRCVALFV